MTAPPGSDSPGHELLGCPSAQGLFQQAVCQSAAAAPLFGFPAHYAEAIAEAMLAKLGVPARDLHTVDPARILQAQTEFMVEKQSGEHPECGRMIPFAPLTGGDLLPQPPYEAITDGVGTDVNLAIGTIATHGAERRPGPSRRQAELGTCRPGGT
ncbi:hypothetical protein DXZ75_11595 [Streptomyces sp. AcE210]|nr:hypothetical protein DXZ75_11595 [Streptomyces sp. AcE210]